MYENIIVELKNNLSVLNDLKYDCYKDVSQLQYYNELRQCAVDSVDVLVMLNEIIKKEIIKLKKEKKNES